jgi:phosphonate transport system substrate-binding protein
MNKLRLSSCQAPNADPFGRELADYLQQRLTISIQFIDDIPWQEREQQLDAAKIDICWICGLPYVWKADQPEPSIELLAAPVMAGPRYQNHPIYFSDVVVRQDSPFQTFTDLRGTTWAYNEPHSHSGHNLTRYQLARRGEPNSYFGRVVESGAHQTSLAMILNGEIDASAIDSTVLETELAANPELSGQIRIIATFGPSPSPPWVIGKHVPAPLRQAVREALMGMAEDGDGRSRLHRARITRFAPVQNSDYDPIRHMEQLARNVIW